MHGLWFRKKQERAARHAGVLDAEHSQRSNSEAVRSGEANDPRHHWAWNLGKALVRLSPDAYLRRYPDVRAAGMNPYWHFLRHGYWEGRQAEPPRKGAQPAIVAEGAERPPGRRSAAQIISLTVPGQILHKSGVVAFGPSVRKRLKRQSVWFADEAVMAVVEIKSEQKEPLVISAYELAANHAEILTARVTPARCLLRASAGFSVGAADWKDSGLFVNKLLRHAASGSVVLLPTAHLRPEEGKLSEAALVERLVILMELYGLSAARAAAALEERRLAGRLEDPESLLAAAAQASAGRIAKRRMLISILGFSFGGGEIMPIRLANGLRRAGWPVLVHVLDTCTVDPGVREMLRFDIPVIATSLADQLGGYVRAYGIDLVNTHHAGTQVLCAAMMKQTGVRVRHIATTHGMYEAMADSELKAATGQLSGYVDAWTCVADKNLPPLRQSGLWPEESFFKLPNGMEPPQIHPLRRADFRIPKHAFVFCIVSRALKSKGWLEAAQAVALARKQSGLDLHLLLVGQGEAYDALTAAPPEPYLHLPGYQRFPCDWYAISDAGLLPSWYPSESTPLTLVESLQCGKPFLASDVGEVANMLQIHGQMAGMVFPLEGGRVNVSALAERMVEMASNTGAYRQMCRLAREKAPEYSLDAVIRRYLEVYNLDLEPADNQLCRFHRMHRQQARLLRQGRQAKNCPHVTVIVPNYNHGRYLRQRLDCIYRQTYQNFDVLLLDDCSSDESPALLREYAARYPEKTTLLLNETNSGGVFHQWRKGILAAAGDLCWIAESDDWCERTFLEKLVPLFFDQRVHLAYAHYIFCRQDGTPIPRAFENNLSEYAEETLWETPFCMEGAELVNAALGVGNCLPNASGVVFRRPKRMGLLEDPAWSSMKICGDWLFYLHMAHGGRVAYTNLTHSYFRIAANSAGASVYMAPAYYQEHETVAKAVAVMYAGSEALLRRCAERVEQFGLYNAAPESSRMKFQLARVLAAADGAGTVSVPEPPQFDPMPTVFIAQIRPASPAEESDLTLAADRVGLNTGNLLFTYALRRQMDATVNVGDPFEPDPSQICANAGAMPVANLIIRRGPGQTENPLRWYAETEFPLTMAGLGAQASDCRSSPEELAAALSEDQCKLFHLAGERAATLGVRGRFTGRCLEAMGICNYRVIGCPSVFIQPDGVWPVMRAPSAQKPLICVTRNQALAKTPALQSKIIRLGMAQHAEWIVQMLTELPPGALRGRVPALEEMKALYPEERWEGTEICRYAAQHTHIFFQYESWQQYLRQEGFTFAFGSRFHGIVAALHAGIPGLLLVHDSRTQELAQTLHLPHITPAQFSGVSSMEQLLPYCDYTAFYRHFRENTENYVRFLQENGLSTRFFQGI